jgi:hypothetical protein
MAWSLVYNLKAALTRRSVAIPGSLDLRPQGVQSSRLVHSCRQPIRVPNDIILGRVAFALEIREAANQSLWPFHLDLFRRNINGARS